MIWDLAQRDTSLCHFLQNINFICHLIAVPSFGGFYIFDERIAIHTHQFTSSTGNRPGQYFPPTETQGEEEGPLSSLQRRASKSTKSRTQRIVSEHTKFLRGC
jgi:hypothetical protein